MLYFVKDMQASRRKIIFRLINYSIAAIWLVNGLFCKVQDLVPRHRQIVAAILGSEYAKAITISIGIAEVSIGIWIITGMWRKWNVIAQLLIIGTMNLLEFFLVPELLLWGRLNIVFAAVLMCIIYYNGFVLARQPKQVTI